MNKRRICYVVPSLGTGGTERQLLALMRGLAEEYQITVVCTRTDGAWAGDARRLAKVKVLSLRSGWDPRMGRALRREFRQSKPDIVHSFMFGFDHAVNKAARAENVPVVISSRRQLADWKKTRHVKLQRKANLLVDGIVANSRAVAEYAAAQENETPDRYTVIYNGIDAEKFVSNTDRTIVRKRLGVPDGKVVVGMVANYTPVKDHVLFVKMAGELCRRRDDVHFVLVGSGPLRGEIDRQIRAKGLAGHVTQLTTIAELPDVYRIMSVKVLTSQNEGFPNVVMEAMASGTPVVASAAGGIPELIENGVTGSLMTSRDPSAFADAVEKYLNDADTARTVGGAAARRIRERFSMGKMVDGYRALYADLLARKGGG
jgi:glycosyltransferase involved in cell wall biosynthesis